MNATTAQTAQATENLEQNASATTEKAVQEGEKDVQAAKGFFEQGLGRVTVRPITSPALLLTLIGSYRRPP